MARGRPPKYKAEYAEQAKHLCKLGATDEDLAEAFKVHVATIYRWQSQYPEFCEASKVGKDMADARVERALYHRAVGYSHDAVKVMQYQGQPVIVPYKERFAPDTTAALKWLNNRKPEEWREQPKDINVNFNANLIVGEIVNRLGPARAREMLEAVAPNLLAQLPATIEGEVA